MQHPSRPHDDQDSGAGLIQAWRELASMARSRVLFENRTCVFITNPAADLAAQAVALLREYGPVQVGTPSGDFNVAPLPDGRGFLVSCHHPDILTVVRADEVDPSSPEVMIGLLGRSKRARDANELRILRVHDRRSL